MLAVKSNSISISGIPSGEDPSKQLQVVPYFQITVLDDDLDLATTDQLHSPAVVVLVLRFDDQHLLLAGLGEHEVEVFRYSLIPVVGTGPDLDRTHSMNGPPSRPWLEA